MPRRFEAKAAVNTVAVAQELDSRKESYADMNDWLNMLVRKRIAKARAEGETLPAEMAWVAEHDHSVYQKRFKPMVFLVLGLAVYGIAQTTQPVALLLTILAFYFYIDVSHLTDDSQELCATWLDELGVACTPGIDFDPEQGHRYVRLSYSESTKDVRTATERIAGWVSEFDSNPG